MNIQENCEISSQEQTIRKAHRKTLQKSRNHQADMTREAMEFMRIKEIVKSSPEENNEDKIKKLKKLITEGKYQVNEDQLAEKITMELL